MRVFIALELEQAVKKQLAAVQEKLRPYVQKGNFSRAENFHITLRFLGEHTPYEVDEIFRCMQKTVSYCSDFLLESDMLGCFHKKRDICYAAVQEHPKLQFIYRVLQDELWLKRLIFQKESYTPHITLAREVVWKAPCEQVLEQIEMNPISIYASGLSLMESTRVDGRLCYVPLAYQGFASGRNES